MARVTGFLALLASRFSSMCLADSQPATPFVNGLLSSDADAAVASMRGSPMSAQTQIAGCKSLTTAIWVNGDALLSKEYVDPCVDAVINHVDDLEVVYSCMAPLQAFAVTFDRERTLAINNGTHIPEMLNAVLKRWAHDPTVQTDFDEVVAGFATYVACEVQPPYAEAGCLDRLWDALDYFTAPADSAVQMSVWQGFSDHAGCEVNSKAIANHGGQNAGIARLVESLKKALGNQFHPTIEHGGDAITLQYEIMAVGNGVLSWADESNGRFDAFVRAGYALAAMNAMKDQPEQRSTNNMGCVALSLLAANTTTHEQLLEAGALELLATTMEKFKGQDHHIFVNQEVGYFYPVIPSCDLALQYLALGKPALEDRLVELGLPHTYSTMREDLASTPQLLVMPAALKTRQALKR